MICVITSNKVLEPNKRNPVNESPYDRSREFTSFFTKLGGAILLCCMFGSLILAKESLLWLIPGTSFTLAGWFLMAMTSRYRSFREHFMRDLPLTVMMFTGAIFLSILIMENGAPSSVAALICVVFPLWNIIGSALMALAGKFGDYFEPRWTARRKKPLT